MEFWLDDSGSRDMEMGRKKDVELWES